MDFPWENHPLIVSIALGFFFFRISPLKTQGERWILKKRRQNWKYGTSRYVNPRDRPKEKFWKIKSRIQRKSGRKPNLWLFVFQFQSNSLFIYAERSGSACMNRIACKRPVYVITITNLLINYACGVDFTWFDVVSGWVHVSAVCVLYMCTFTLDSQPHPTSLIISVLLRRNLKWIQK